MNRRIRTFHRWIAIAFVLGVLAYMVAMSWGQPSIWSGLAAALPLLLLVGTGLYLLVLPYVVRRRATQRGQMIRRAVARHA